MTQGFIDSASAFEVVATLTNPRAIDSYRMAWDRALQVTATLISADQIKLAPSPRREGPKSGAYGVLMDGLGSTVSSVVLPAGAGTDALRKTQRWTNRNVPKLRRILAPFIDRPPNTGNEAALWLQYEINYAWAEHSRRFGGLFDRDFLPQLSRVLDVEMKDVTHAWSLSGNESFVESAVRRQPDSDEFRLVRDAFIVSALLRGRYHEYAAESANLQLLSHPIREPVLKRLPRAGVIPIDVPNTERYLASIVLAGAFAERGLEARIRLWIENVLRLRAARAQINLTAKDRDETARDTAIDAAKRFGVRNHSRKLATILDIGVGIGSSALTSFVLSPWESMAVGSGMTLISANRQLGHVIASATTTTRQSLTRLSSLRPGRIERHTADVRGKEPPPVKP